ncbi:MAG: glycyl-radical enzyme activating protein [Clostridia bacterium]|nr:glycyl-radical enzyme activating protein [Clostridia bacterium]
MEGIIFDIQRFSISDGPGIRTTVFLKGCSLKCIWCHNPESINSKKELQIVSHKCIGCGNCIAVCRNHGYEMIDEKKVYYKDRCQLCGECVSQCYSKSLQMSGKNMTVEEVMTEIRKDLTFYEDSNGGVTFSGGEPLLQSLFLKELLKKCQSEGIHTAVDTAGNVPFGSFMHIIDYTDLFLFDLKMMDREKHKKYTGAFNDLIHANLKKLVQLKKHVFIRIPVIPGINNSKEDMQKLIEFIKNLPIDLVELLPYHSLGGSKYESLAIPYELASLKTPTKEEMTEIGKWFKQANINVKVS